MSAQDETLSINEPNKPLTKHAVGSLKEVWALSYPLMLSCLSGTLMIFLDRLILARYQTDAMNAAAFAGTVFYIFFFSAMSIAGIAEVFVGQYNGAQKFKKIGGPVWAMIWFSGFLIIPCVLFGAFGGHFFIPETMMEHGEPFLRWLFYFFPSFVAVTAISAFFIGRGKVVIVTYAVTLGNCLNLVLNLVLVYGIDGIIPTLGTMGSAIASGLSELAIFIYFLKIFLSKENQEKYNTSQWRFQWEPFKACFKIGLPNALGHTAGIAAWALIIQSLSQVTFAHVTVFTIGQSIYILFTFISDGSQKAISTLCANLIGSKQIEKIKLVLKSGLTLQLIYAFVLAVPLILMPGTIVDWFLPDELPAGNVEELRDLAIQGCFWIWVAVLGDAFSWVIAGVLLAAGDTLFIMLAVPLMNWLLAFLPVYWFVILNGSGPVSSVMLMGLYCIILSCVFYARYASKIWTKKANLMA